MLKSGLSQAKQDSWPPGASSLTRLGMVHVESVSAHMGMGACLCRNVCARV